MSRTIVLTGVTRGIGAVALRHLLDAEPDDHYVVLARDPAGADLPGRVTAVAADLTSLAEVRDAADRIGELVRTGAIAPPNLLVANAGIQYTDDLTVTGDGFEATFAVNVLANHVLARAVLPLAAPSSRFVVTVSDTHFGDLRHNLGMVPGPSWPADPALLAAPGTFPRPSTVKAGRTAYSTSKLAAIYLIHEYARRFPGVEVVGFNPGFVPGTELARNAGAVSRWAMRRVLPLMTHTPLATTVDDAGRHLADVALGRTVAPSGGYVDRGSVEPSSAESYDQVREQALWDTVEVLTSPFLSTDPPKSKPAAPTE